MLRHIILASALLTCFFATFGQRDEVDKIAIAFRIKKDFIANGFVHDRTNYWLTSSDKIPNLDSLTRFFFSPIYAGNTIDRCSFGDTLNADFIFVTNFYPLKGFDEMESQLLDSANTIGSFRFGDKTVHVYVASIKGQMCKCSYRDVDKAITQMYVPIDRFKIQTLVDPEKKVFMTLDYSKFDFSFFSDVKRK